MGLWDLSCKPMCAKPIIRNPECVQADKAIHCSGMELSMTFFKVRTLQVALGAAVLSLAGLASAQMDQAKPATDSAAAAMQAPKPAMKKHNHHKGHHKHHHKHGDNSSREAAAANAEMKKGQLADGQGVNQYERNAVARCQVFKTDVDRIACVERVRAGAVSGSVKEGGILREVTVEEVIR